MLLPHTPRPQPAHHPNPRLTQAPRSRLDLEAASPPLVPRSRPQAVGRTISVTVSAFSSSRHEGEQLAMAMLTLHLVRFISAVLSAMPIAASAKRSSGCAFAKSTRPSWPIHDWRNGRYLAEGVSPTKGLAVARMAAHITYILGLRAATAVRARCSRAKSNHLYVLLVITRIALRHSGVRFCYAAEPSTGSGAMPQRKTPI